MAGPFTHDYPAPFPANGREKRTTDFLNRAKTIRGEIEGEKSNGIETYPGRAYRTQCFRFAVSILDRSSLVSSTV